MGGRESGAQGAPRTLEALLENVRVRTLGFAKYLGCGDDAEDIAQETMMVLLKRYAGVADAEELLKLAPKICANLALNWRRHKANPARAMDLPEAMADTSGKDPESAAIQADIQGRLLKAIQASAGRCKELLRLRLEGATTKEIAARLGITAGAVDTAYFRCQQRLKAALGGTR